MASHMAYLPFVSSPVARKRYTSPTTAKVRPWGGVLIVGFVVINSFLRSSTHFFGNVVRSGFVAGAGAIAFAVVIAAEERSASPHTSRDGADFAGLGALRVFLGADQVIVRVVPVGTPFPGVAGHVIETESIGRKGGDGR